MKALFLFFILIFSFSLQADPAPFGLVLNKTTVEELKNKYPVKDLGTNKYNGLEAYDIAPQYIDFEGLLAIKAAFSDDGILKMVQMSLPQTKFEAVFLSLSKKYRLVYKNLPPEGNKEAKFEDGNSYILLYALQNVPDMDFLYVNKKLLDEALQTKPVKSNRSKSTEISQL